MSSSKNYPPKRTILQKLSIIEFPRLWRIEQQINKRKKAERRQRINAFYEARGEEKPFFSPKKKRGGKLCFFDFFEEGVVSFTTFTYTSSSTSTARTLVGPRVVLARGTY